MPRGWTSLIDLTITYLQLRRPLNSILSVVYYSPHYSLLQGIRPTHTQTHTHLAFLATFFSPLPSPSLPITVKCNFLLMAERWYLLHASRTRQSSRPNELSTFCTISLFLYLATSFSPSCFVSCPLRYACSQAELNIHFVLHFLVP